LRLLRNVRGIDLVELPRWDECCGFGGTFAVKNVDTSAAMLADKMEAVIETRAEVLCAGDRSCLMHIGGGLDRIRAGVRTLHLSEILASAEAARARARRSGPTTRRSPRTPSTRLPTRSCAATSARPRPRSASGATG
jgi:L-lactate dehydrogenase complex protein LldE